MAVATALGLAVAPTAGSKTLCHSGPCRETRNPAAAASQLYRTAFFGGQLRSAHLANRHVAAVQRVVLPGVTARYFDPLPEEEEKVREWPDPEFIAEVLAEFPEKAIASVEEARVLYSEGGYTYLDVRSKLEIDEVGKIRNSVNIPMVKAWRVFSKEENKKVVKKEPNADFLSEIQKKFPKKDAKLLIACSDGNAYSMDALIALDEAGYTNLVGLKGGYYAWNRIFDNKLGRRRSGEYKEEYSHGAESAGIHASGAGFERMDAIERWVPPSY
eukprot:TRINITY_DN19132_c0_g1_i1.p1 TRINITY_DN19132_c0_g1~~TRINITY_DN19132_c0_g1_i1.p1  ORF type:complete len:272 (+),score=62.04 TRINITY_DN19132_c0_g1_i1:68-883(+)